MAAGHQGGSSTGLLKAARVQEFIHPAAFEEVTIYSIYPSEV